jgi:glycosyltransferase involved in cell wall biosynthesis
MRMLILAAGHLGGADQIAAGREPRLDVFELQAALDADVLDYNDVDASKSPAVRAVRRTLGASAALATLAADKLDNYDAVLTTGEDVGVPLAALLTGRRRRPAHTMIAHTLTPWKKRLFFHLLRVQTRIDRFLCYATSEERHMVDRLGIPADKVSRISFHADPKFFRPMPEIAVEPDLVCSAGQLLRDYDCLIDACRELPVRVSIAAGSPWISKELRPEKPLPANVQWGRYGRFELRELYARSACAVVPIYQNDYQTGISTILEMMAMGKCVIASRTRGQTDTIIDGVNGLYVAPGDRKALRDAIEWVLGHPAEAARIGAAARRFIEKDVGLDLFVARIADSVRAAASGRLPT